MPLLRVDFQEGFSGQEVVVRIDGREQFRAPAKTRVQVGLAAIVETFVPSGLVSVEIELPQSQKVHLMALELERDTYVGVSIDRDGTLSHGVTFDPPGYL